MEVKFPKERILEMSRFAKRKDLLSVILNDGKDYTIEEVFVLLDKTLKGE